VENSLSINICLGSYKFYFLFFLKKKETIFFFEKKKKREKISKIEKVKNSENDTWLAMGLPWIRILFFFFRFIFSFFNKFCLFVYHGSFLTFF
jgi:hypothetical protein